LLGKMSDAFIDPLTFVFRKEAVTGIAEGASHINSEVCRDQVVLVGLRQPQEIVKLPQSKEAHKAACVRHKLGTAVQAAHHVFGVEIRSEVLTPFRKRKAVIDALADRRDLRRSSIHGLVASPKFAALSLRLATSCE
jgi:hypothetical protein